MYYGKSGKISGVSHGTVIIKDFSAGINSNKDEENLSVGECDTCYNFEVRGGTLKDGCGLKRAEFGGISPRFVHPDVTPVKLYFYKRYDVSSEKYIEIIMIYGSDGFIYKAVAGEATFVKIQSLEFPVAPHAVGYNYNGEDVIIFSDGKSEIKVYDGSAVTVVADVPAITSMCIHSERLFATEGGSKTSLWFSDDFDPLNWKVSLNDAGFIEIREGAGSLLKVLSFAGYVFVFGSYGIIRVAASGNQTDFSVDGIAASSGKICADSITVCGDRIIYLAEDGFYTFAGGTPARIMSRLDGKLSGINNDDAKGCYFNGNYYCKLNIKSDGRISTVLLKYDLHRGTFSVTQGVNVVDFTLYEGENECRLLFLTSGSDEPAELTDKAVRFNVPLYKKWTSGKSDFKITETKRVVRLSLKTITDIEVTLISERGSRLLRFYGSEKRQSLPVGLCGDCFTVTIECRAPCSSISALKIEYEY